MWEITESHTASLCPPACFVLQLGVVNLSHSLCVCKQKTPSGKRHRVCLDRNCLSLSETAGQFYPVQRNRCLRVCGVCVCVEKDKESTGNIKIPLLVCHTCCKETSTWKNWWDFGAWMSKSHKGTEDDPHSSCRDPLSCECDSPASWSWRIGSLGVTLVGLCVASVINWTGVILNSWHCTAHRSKVICGEMEEPDQQQRSVVPNRKWAICVCAHTHTCFCFQILGFQPCMVKIKIVLK